MIERTLFDYYRCPEHFVKMSLGGDLSPGSGYFRFGSSICYGQSARGSLSRVPSTALVDVLPDGIAGDGLLRVPFDPSQVIDNLRLERYATDSWRSTNPVRQMPWLKSYYSLRRYMPSRLRLRLQRTYFRNWKSLTFPGWPVDSSVDQILQRLLCLSLRSQGIARLPFIWFWPDGAPSCAVVTHDVETVVGRDRCSWLMDLDDQYEIKASFQVVPEERYAVSPAFLDEIRTRGFEINVHDLNHDGRLFSNRDEFLRRADRINHHVRAFGARGFRSGGLYRHPDWYDALAIAYDMSVPNVGHLEVQRGGCCTVMPYFIGRIVELPVTTSQDYSVFGILKDFSNDLWKDQIESIMSQHGLLSFIIHPDYQDAERPRHAYRMLLDRLSGLREAGMCWVTLPGDVERWWRQRSRLTLLQEGGQWRIEGPGKERARIAYAELDGDDLTYTVEPPVLYSSLPSPAVPTS